MIKMDFKGIRWVGNVYQKFEAMCLEVEEAMYEDTVKYVENQVQTVGASVKKFYSEVMKEVVDPSSIDPVKVAAADLSLNPYADFSFHKKPKVSNKKDDVASHKRGCEGLKVKDEQKVLNRDISSTAKSRGVIKRLPRRENNLPSEVSQSFVPTCKISDYSRVTTHQTNNEFCTDNIPDSGPVKDIDKVASAIVSTANIILPSETVAKEDNRQSTDTSSHCLADVSTTAINGACGNDGDNSMLGSYISCDLRTSESAYEDSSPTVSQLLNHYGKTGDTNVHFIESDDDMAEPRAEAIQEFDKSNCVVVGREDLSVASPKEDKPKSYKKKIRKAFLSKSSARKQEYKQLAVEHGSTPEVLNEEESPPHRVPESEWELL